MYETTCTMVIGPVHRMGSGPGTMLGTHLLVLEEGSRARWRLVGLDAGQEATLLAVAKTPDNLLAQGLIAYLASRPGAPAIAENPRLEPLAARDAAGGRFTTRMPHAAVADVLSAWPADLGLLVTTLPGSSIRDEHVAELRATGTWVRSARTAEHVA